MIRAPSIPRSLFVFGLGLCLGSAGCASSAAGRTGSLPFIVRLRQVVKPKANPGEAPVVPARFGKEEDLALEIAHKLDETRIFEMVLDQSEESDLDADLEIQVTINGDDFGAGTPKISGAFFSTVTWLLAGHLSWMIKDREYPRSKVALDVVIEETGGLEKSKREEERRGERGIFEDAFPVKEADLSFHERAGRLHWFYNILVPPWWGEGDPERAGASLAHRATELFVRQEAGRIASRLPLSYLDKRGSLLVHDREDRSLLIASRQRLVKLEISDDGGSDRTLTSDELGAYDVSRKDITRGVPARIRVLVDGFIAKPEYFYYRLPIEGDRGGWIRLSANLSEGATSFTNQWSVYRGPPRAEGTGPRVSVEPGSVKPGG